MSNNHDLYVRVQARPSLPPFLAFALLLSLPVGLGLASEFANRHGDYIISFLLVPAFVWFFYGRPTRKKGWAFRAIAVTMTMPFLVQGLFSGWEWVNYNTPYTGHYRLSKWNLCQYHVPTLALGKTFEKLDYNSCEDAFIYDMKVKVCSSVKNKYVEFPHGFEQCSAMYRNGRIW